MPTFEVEAVAGRGLSYRAKASYDYIHDHETGDVSASFVGVQNGEPESGPSAGYRRISRVGLVFDTAALPIGTSIISASIEFTEAGLVWEPAFSLVVVSGGGLHNPLIPEDYGQLLGHVVSQGSISSSTINDNGSGVYANSITLNSLGRAAINPSLLTIFGLRHSRDISDTAPEGSDGQVFLSVVSGQRAKLVIDYSIGEVWEPGYIWASDEAGEETELHYIDESGAERAFEGEDTGNNGDPGYLWAEGTYLHYIDSNGDERRTEGTKEGATGVASGQFWIEDAKLRYIDASGDERYIEGS